MRRVDRFRMVQDIAARNERDRANELAQFEKQLQVQDFRLAELEQYRHSYEQQLRDRAVLGVGAAGVRDYQVFLARLDEALKQQQSQRSHAAAEVDAARTQWQEAAQRAQVLNTLTERWHADELSERERREQREFDELAQRDSQRIKR
jgi:flagellar FliJ protein